MAELFLTRGEGIYRGNGTTSVVQFDQGFSVQFVSLGRCCDELRYTHAWQLRTTPKLSERHRVFEFTTTSVVRVAAVTEPQSTPIILTCTPFATGNLRYQTTSGRSTCCTHAIASALFRSPVCTSRWLVICHSLCTRVDHSSGPRLTLPQS